MQTGLGEVPARERDWLVPSIALTLFSGLIGIAMIPSYAGVLPALTILPWWMLAAAILGGIYCVAAMMIAGVQRPVAQIRRFLVEQWRTAALVAFALFLSGLNMTTFMWTKPLLNYFVDFWADPLLADIDHMLFLGHDPWSLLSWLNSTPAAIFYHRGWFALMIVTLFALLAARPSREKAALMMTYFVLWSVVGPLIHTLLPAAGPVFYAQLGLGDRFADLEAVPETRALVSYLWSIYATEGFGPGSGISAMPSMHIATTAWMVIAVWTLARSWIVPMGIAAALIFLLSISLGWHYAVDGIVAAAAALACYRLLHALYGYAPAWRRQAALAC